MAGDPRQEGFVALNGVVAGVDRDSAAFRTVARINRLRDGNVWRVNAVNGGSELKSSRASMTAQTIWRLEFSSPAIRRLSSG